MKYTIELVNNHPRCKVMTLDRRFFVLEDYELFQLIRNIETDRNYREHSGNSKNLFLKHSKMDISVLFKDYDDLYLPLVRLYNRFMKQEVKNQKIQNIKTKAAIGIITSGLVSATLIQQFSNALDNKINPMDVVSSNPTYFESIDNEKPIKINDGELTIESNNAYFTNLKVGPNDGVHEEILTVTTPHENTEVIEVSSDVEPVEETKDIEVMENSINPNLVSVDTEAVYDKGINDRVDKYMESINKYAHRRGLSPELVYDIASQEYGGEGSNVMHVVPKSWYDFVITTFNFDKNMMETMVITENPDKHKNVDIVITNEDLKNSKTNIAVGCIILQYSLATFDYNIPLGIQAYNNGVTGVRNIVETTSNRTGLSEEDILDSVEPIWLPNTDVIEYGDKNYFKNVVKHIDEDQIDSKVNDVYSVQYMEDGEVQTSEAQFKLR